MIKLGARIAAVALTGLVAACTVQPVYAPATPEAGASVSALRSIYIEPVNDRVSQRVRNELIFLFNGGSAQSDEPEYELDLTVSKRNKKVLVVLTDLDGEPTASTVKITVNYRLTRVSDDTIIGNHRTSGSASYDLTNQEYANIRAERDAENRAARDVAERLRALIATDLKRAGAL